MGCRSFFRALFVVPLCFVSLFFFIFIQIDLLLENLLFSLEDSGIVKLSNNKSRDWSIMVCIVFFVFFLCFFLNPRLLVHRKSVFSLDNSVIVLNVISEL